MVEKRFVALQYVLRPKPPLIAGISDYSLSLMVPVVTHWLTAAVYEIFQRFELFQEYRIHTSEEERVKNTISRLECLRGVILVQVRYDFFSLPLACLMSKS
jgi:sphinganine C4-monooxygenase